MEANNHRNESDNESEEEDLQEEEEEDAEDVLEAQLHHPLWSPDLSVPPEMQLTQEEHEWALDIARTIQATAELDNLTDFVYAQMAIVTEGDMDRALEIALQMQEFKEEYKVLDSLEDALRHMEDICISRGDGTGERFVLAIDPNPETGGYVFICDVAKLDLRRYRSLPQIQRFFTGIYYQSLAMTVDFKAVRSGVINVVECEGYQWKNNMLNLDFFTRMLNNTAGIFPIRMKKTYFLNSPMLFNTMVSMAKSVLPREITSSFQIGCKHLAFGRLDTVYNNPNPRVAEARLQASAEGLLRKRYHNVKTFKL